MLNIAHHAITFLLLITTVSSRRIDYEVNLEMASTNWSDVYADYCGDKCSGESKVWTKTGTYCPDPMCFSCECEHHCLFKGTCCPSIYEDETNFEKVASKVFGEMDILDVYKRTTCTRIPKSWRHGTDVLTVSRCPNSWKDENVRQKCEHPSFDSMESMTFLSDVKTGLAFRNIYCVQCNGLESNKKIFHQSYSRTGNVTEITSIQPIPYAFTCDSYDDIYYVTDPFELFKFAWENARGLCSITINIYSNLIGCSYTEGPYSTTAIMKFDSCPPGSSEILRDLCDKLPPIPGLRVSGAKNLFCSLCNVISRIEIDICDTSRPPSFKTLFGTHERDNLEEDELGDKLEICGSTNTTRKKTDCLPVSCPVGKVTSDDYSMCQTAVDKIRGLTYQFIVTWRPEPSIPKDSWETFAGSLHELLLESVPSIELNYEISLLTCSFTDELLGHAQEINLDGYIRASKRVLRDVFEENIMKALIASTPWRVTTTNPDGSTYTISLWIACLGKEICDIYRSQSDQQNCSVVKNVIGSGFEDPKSDYPKISSKLTCPYVSVQPASGPFVLNKTIQLSIEINHKTINVDWNPSSMSYGNGKVHICLFFYKRLVEELEKSRQSADEIILVVHYYLDIVCILVSCVLLSAAIVTYLLFPSLRTVPGLNTLCLCISLLTAQVSLLTTTVFTYPGMFTEIHCVVHGVIIHYSWVASFTWMNACCIHMYRVFTGKITGSKQKQFTLNCVYSFGFPLLMVIATIIVTAVLTQGNSIGYDKTTCFLDTNTSILIIIMGLLVPLLLTVVTSTVLFVMTMSEIISIRRLKIDNKNQQGVLTYVKLSAVTGLSCLVTATAIQFNNPILSLIASPLAGLQGVFIFFSFTANRRVLNMYKYFISRGETKPPPSARFSSTKNDMEKKTTATNTDSKGL